MSAASALPVAAVRVAPPGLRSDLRAVRVVWQRELIRFGQDRIRIVAALVQPVLFLFVLGTGLQSLTSASTGGTSLRTFMFPGVLATSVLFTAMFSAISIVWDREFGFLREMLVAPVRRGSILVGKCLGGATVATLQGLLVLVLAPLVDVPYDAVMLLELIVVMFLLAFALTAFGLVIAARISNIQTVMGVMQVLLFPLAFLSGSLYPIGRAADLDVHRRARATRSPTPCTSRATSSSRTSTRAPAARAALDPPITWGGWAVPGAALGRARGRHRPRPAGHRDRCSSRAPSSARSGLTLYARAICDSRSRLGPCSSASRSFPIRPARASSSSCRRPRPAATTGPTPTTRTSSGRTARRSWPRRRRRPSASASGSA